MKMRIQNNNNTTKNFSTPEFLLPFKIHSRATGFRHFSLLLHFVYVRTLQFFRRFFKLRFQNATKYDRHNMFA